MKKVYLKEDGGFLLCALYEDGEFVRFYRLPTDLKTGSIVVGKVKFVKKGVGVFVDIGLDRDGVLTWRADLKSGDAVLVRIEMEPQETRGCSLSEKITLAGKYVVVTDDNTLAFSKSIDDRLKEELSALAPSSGGVIFRSLCTEGKKEDVEKEIISLRKKLDEILFQAKNTSPVRYLYTESALGVIEKLAEETVYGFDKSVGKDVEELGERKVLKEGVELVFDKTEAMTVVDVNFHTSEERGERAVFSADIIAVKEFARQVRLRNIGGLIALDYISLTGKTERKELFRVLCKELKKDFVRCNVEHAEKAGVFIVTRTDRYSS